MAFRETLRNELQSKRQLTASTSKTYVSLLVSIQRKLGNEDNQTVSFFKNNKKDILEHIEGLEKAQTKKTLLSALYVLTNDDDYREKMLSTMKVVNDHYKAQKTDPDRLKNLMSFDEVKRLHEEYKNAWKRHRTDENFFNLMISSLCSGAVDGLPPRRVLDYACMKWTKYDINTDNYYKNGKFYFNVYKTKKNKGKQEVTVPAEIVKLMNIRKKMTGSGPYLLYNEQGDIYSQSALSKKIKRLFHGNSQDVLRSIFLSNLYKGLPAVSHLQDIADTMGHSIDSALAYYVKKD